MPRYFFHQVRRGGLIEDLEGSELPDIDVARGEAIDGAREMMMSDAIHAGIDISSRRFEITDEQGAVVLSLSFTEAIALVE
ncbi:hypothetical protein LB518_11555 [Mesorhizobium sp. BR1-1-16]|uniref:DUF6894 family protein n=1 Tax=Mesorhizobium sp. BR1-1-16 TaxID=2876653 RepID=UPI001CCC197A|nr:hypothetical protein [Mesorhizobium sp. BR1-1-16]MBZ9936933.1 hypothetical protein [Mesorhizobium sp. BR1-1-16]